MAESLTLATVAGTGSINLMGATGFTVVAHSYPAPQRRPLFASSADTEGSLLVSSSFENRTISVDVEIVRSSAALLEGSVADLQELVGQVGREGGTLTWVTPGGSTVIFDLVTDEAFEPVFDVSFSLGRRAAVSMVFTAKPFGRGTPVTLSDHTETTAPALVFTETSITGDVPALGKLVIDEDDAEDQAWVVWGQQQRYYSSAASAALFIEAEDLTTQGGSTKTAGATGASGAGSNVVRNTDLTTSFVSILSGQLSASSTYLSHVGTFRVFARVYCPTGNTGTVEVALEWSEGDFLRATRNATVEYESAWEGSFRLMDLGLVSLTEVAQGTQRWEPRVLARSTAVGDEIDVDWLMFVPVDEGAGEAAATFAIPAPSSFTARDEFAQTAGGLNGKTLPVGGTWSGAGDADDFSVSGAGTAIRTALSDASQYTGRFGIAGASTPTNTVVQATFSVNAYEDGTGAAYHGVFARYTDTSNNMVAVVVPGSRQMEVWKEVAGTITDLLGAPVSLPFSIELNTSYTVRLAVFAGGVWTARVSLASAAGTSFTVGGQDSALATGGTLASGRFGMYDACLASNAITRTYDNFAAWTPVPDAAVFASQSLEVRHDRVIREDSTGAIWTPVSSYAGDYLLIPPTGPDARTNRFIVKGSRNAPGNGADSGIDDISARLTYTPRWLVVPS